MALSSLFSATELVSWRFHIHSAIVLLPFLYFLLAGERIPESWMMNWSVIPVAMMFLTDVLALLLVQTSLSLPVNHALVLYGGTGLILGIMTLLRSMSLFEAGA